MSGVGVYATCVAVMAVVWCCCSGGVSARAVVEQQDNGNAYVSARAAIKQHGNATRSLSGRVVEDGDSAAFWAKREELVAEDYSKMIGSSLVLSPEEELVNDLLKKALSAEMDSAFTTLDFAPSRNFLSAIKDINLSQVFAIIREMPKGAVLHSHDIAATSLEFVISNITYMEHLYICDNTNNGIMFFSFSDSKPSESKCSVGWKLVRDVRASYDDPQDFDTFLYYKISLVTKDPEGAYPDINSVWKEFENYFIAVGSMLSYRPAFEAYITQAMVECQQDGIPYIEFRGILFQLHELDGTQLSQVETFRVYKSIVDTYVAQHKDDFFGARFIYAPHRRVEPSTIWDYVSVAKSLHKEFPTFFAGFDLVGQEDLGRPLKDFIEPLATLSDENIPLFYHSGETNWYGEDTDENLFDALLLNASRLGHGYAITKHPRLMQEARDKDTPLEICPISNQVLMLVEDLRNHPAVGLVASDFPLVVSSDDPGAWGALPQSHDFYEAFMAFGGARADLKLLKQLALNSIKYSSLDEAGKTALTHMWEGQWETFINTIVEKITQN